MKDFAKLIPEDEYHEEESRDLRAPLLLEMVASHAIDGDTIKALYRQMPFTIRLQGIDTLETRPGKRLNAQAKALDLTKEEAIGLGVEAKDRLNHLLEHEIMVELKGKPEFDRYGRLIAKVMVEEHFLQKHMVYEGLAMVSRYRYGPNTRNKFMKELYKLEREARQARRGIWKQTTDKGESNETD